MKAALYVRVSTDEQAREGFSIPAQRERLRLFCESQGWEIVEEFVEEGWSAKDINRPQLQRMLKDIKKHKFDIVLVYRLDRLTRSVLDLYLLLDTFDKYDVKFRSATEVYDTTSAMGRLFLTLVAALAQWERENLAERVRFGIEQMIDEGKKPGGHSPYGYQFDKNFNCKIIEDEAEFVRKIFDWYIDGFGYRGIAERLNQLGIKPRLAKEWNPNSVRDIILNDMYIGTYRWGNKVKINNHPAIISEPVYKKAQNVMKNKALGTDTSRRGKFVLTGLLKCGHCEENSMQGFYDKRDEQTYYRCMKCNRMTNEKRLLEPILKEIHQLTTSESYFIQKFKQHQEKDTIDVPAIKKKIQKIQLQKEKWYDVYMDEDNPIPKEVLFNRINKLNQEENELQVMLDQAEYEDETLEEKFQKISQLKDFKKYFIQADNFRKKELLSILFEKIVMHRERGKLKPVELEYYLR